VLIRQKSWRKRAHLIGRQIYRTRQVRMVIGHWRKCFHKRKAVISIDLPFEFVPGDCVHVVLPPWRHFTATLSEKGIRDRDFKKTLQVVLHSFYGFAARCEAMALPRRGCALFVLGYVPWFGLGPYQVQLCSIRATRTRGIAPISIFTAPARQSRRLTSGGKAVAKLAQKTRS